MVVTLREVAERAGVSRSAVSRTFTDGASVSAKMRQKVEKAAQELGYHPNALASSLTTGRTKLIGLVSNNFHNSIFLEVFDLFTRALQDVGLRPLLVNLSDETDPANSVRMLRQYGISTAPGAEPEAQVCGECGGRLLGVTGKDGRIWYRCEHVQHYGNLLPACPSCGTALPRHVDGTSEARCCCGATYPACPECEDGWLVERSGRYGHFLGCVRYPSCVGKARISAVRRNSSAVKVKH